MKLTTRDRRTLALGMVAIVPLLSWLVVGRPVWRSLAELRTEVAQQRSLAARELGLIAAQQRGQLVSQHEAARKFVEGHTLLASDGTLLYARATAWLNTLASLSGVRLESARVQAESTEEGKLQKLDLLLQGRGELSGLLVFLQRVEQGNALARVERLQVSPPRARATGAELDFALSFSVYGATRP
jgi:hypothetical protein